MDAAAYAELRGDAVTDRVDVGPADAVADREMDRLGRTCIRGWWGIGGGQGWPPS